MSEFNDPDLERVLGRAGGKYPDVNVALQQLHGRVRYARRRRAVVVGGAACILLFTTALVAANRTDGSQPSQIGDRDNLDVAFPDDTLADNGGDTIDDTIDGSVPETHSAGGSPSSPKSTAPDTTGTDDTESDDDPTSSSPTTTPAPPTTSVFSGDGGSITVRLQDGSLTLVSHTATDGHSVEIQHSSGERVEVRFQSETHRTRIRIDLEGSSMVPRIEETET